MVSYNLPLTGLQDAVSVDHITHAYAIHDIINRFDKDDLPAHSGQFLAYNAATGLWVKRNQLPINYIQNPGANYTLALADDGKVVEMHDSNNARSIIVPAESSVNFPLGCAIVVYAHSNGQVVNIIPQDATVEIVANIGGVPRSTVDPASFKLNGRYAEAVLRKRHSNAGNSQWVLTGNVALV